jgi:membrane protease YdiL (CAAX protease family)
MSLADLGLTTRNLGRSTALGCAVYIIALVSFLHCSDASLMQNHGIRTAEPTDAAVLLGLMCVIAAGTDLAARGFILLTLARHSHVVFAILMQNVLWYLGHREEINLLVDCLGVWLATTLTLTLGILGDIVVLRTRNVVGLALAHILLNVILGAYLRFL